MDEKAAQAVRNKKDSSMRVGLKLVREGMAAGFLTAGNTGAAMATAKMVLGALPGVDRPALAMVLPTTAGTPLCAARRGRQCRLQLAQSGAVRHHGRAVRPLRAQDCKAPRGLLSIGEEEGKGNELTGETFPLLKALPLDFIGNVEGRDLYNGHADVIVCDGFVGNVGAEDQ